MPEQKVYYANYDCECNKCACTIFQDDEIHFFNGDKICDECWRKLVELYKGMN